VLGAAGIYAVISCTVAKQRREIGLRMALGANRTSVVGRVLMHSLRLAGVGVVVGIALALVLARFLGSLVYDVSVSDARTLAASACVLLVIAAAASLLPAWHASRVDPMLTRRQD
jgi:putative ABC transport system permease protein